MARQLHPELHPMLNAIPIWISNTRTTVSYQRALFTLICDNLGEQFGWPEISERYESLLTLASLPWLDQPQFLEPIRLIFEVHDAWDELWTLQMRNVVGGAHATGTPRSRRAIGSQGSSGEETLGSYLARPLHELAVFAAGAGAGAQLRVGTHRRLIAEPELCAGWRVIRGGATG